MLARLFPKQIDNAYGGSVLAIWLLVLVVFVRLPIGFNTMVMTSEVLRNADGVPLDTFNPLAVDAFIKLTQVSALRHLLMTLVGVVALIRYRALIPFVYLFFLVEQVGRRVVAEINPVTPLAGGTLPIGFAINLALL